MIDTDSQHLKDAAVRAAVLSCKELPIMKHTKLFRGLFYGLGLLILALGLTLNTKTGLGTSAIISVPYSISVIWNLNFGNVTLVVYLIFITAQLLLHCIPYRKQVQTGKPAANRRRLLLFDLLQFPLSLLFTRFLNFFSSIFPGCEAAPIPLRLLILALAITLTGIGAAMSLDMRLVPNPGDGIVQAIADTAGKNIGFTKNCFDLANITVTAAISLLLTQRLVGIGIGTVAAVLGVGRIIALYHRICGRQIRILAGMEAPGLSR